MAKPILKWLGGKTQILDSVLSLFPSVIIDYHEPFVGGGSVLLGLLEEVRQGKRELQGKVYASDINPNLIALYKNVQSNVEGLIQELKKLDSVYKSIQGTHINREAQNEQEAFTSQESYFYWIRKQFNALADRNSLQASAMMIFLNKTGFRGVYRENKDHIYNAPFGHYKKPTILDENNLRRVSSLIKDVVFICQPFEQSIQAIQAMDFVYFDPPYVPEKATSFTSYTGGGFPGTSHQKLFTFCQTLREKSVYFVMSNSNVPLVTDNFTFEHFDLYLVPAKRAIHSKDPSAMTDELLITNS